MSGWGFVEALVCLEQGAWMALLSTVPMPTFSSGALMKLREFLVFGPVWGTVRGSARRLKPTLQVDCWGVRW